jgi:uncharacterized protein
MRTISRISTIVLFITSIASAQPIAWQDWSSDIFQRAAREHKFVLLDLGTQWCHWCHVMDVQTYADAKVQKLIAEKYIAVKTDADARPDLGNRYEDYGWPATVVFNATGGEIVKRQGFLAADEMASMLQAIIEDPTPGPSVVAQKPVQYGNQSALTQAVRDELLRRHLETYDSAQGSWGHGQKFLDWDNTEWAMRLANRGDSAEEKMARQTLAAQLNLLDPAWGGVYQYSTDDDWHHPHFEKIMQMQSENLRIYSLAFAQWHDPTYLAAAQSIHHYLTRFLLSPNGGFFTSQDADLIDGVHSAEYFALTDAQRTERGIPRIDKHQYSRENGWAIRSLAGLYETTGDESALSEAKSAANWVLANRALPGGGFSHDQTDAGGPYLGDTLSMGHAFLELYQATGDRAYLHNATQTADFILAHFVNPTQPGLATSDVHSAAMFTPTAEFDENVNAARFLNLLAQYSGRAPDAALAKISLRYIATPDVALARRVAVGGLLLADGEQGAPALHMTIVGPKSDPTALALFRVALQFPSTYKRVEWYDPAEGPLGNSDVNYPHFPKPAAYFCTATSCSRPVFTVADFQARLQRVKN